MIIYIVASLSGRLLSHKNSNNQDKWLWFCHHDKVIAIVHLVHLMNVKQLKAAANPQTKSINQLHEFTSRLLSSTVHTHWPLSPFSIYIYMLFLFVVAMMMMSIFHNFQSAGFFDTPCIPHQRRDIKSVVSRWTLSMSCTPLFKRW